MTLNTTPKSVTYTIDATDRTLGRVASEAAHALLGKRSVHFAKNQALPMQVVVKNVGKLHLPVRRVKGKIYSRYTGYPGGQRFENYAKLTARRGHKEVLRRAVLGMLPKNKLQMRRIKMLTIED